MNGCLFAVPIANFPIFKTQINCGRWQQFADFHLCHVFIFEMLKMHIELEYLSVICYTNFYLPNTEIQISGISHSFLRWCPAICPNWNWFFFSIFIAFAERILFDWKLNDCHLHMIVAEMLHQILTDSCITIDIKQRNTKMNIQDCPLLRWKKCNQIKIIMNSSEISPV